MPQNTKNSVTTSLPTREENLQKAKEIIREAKRASGRETNKALGGILPHDSAPYFGEKEAEEALKQAGLSRDIWKEAIEQFFPDRPARAPRPAPTDD